MKMTQRSERCLELRLKEAEGCCGWRPLYATSRSWKVNIVKRKPRVSTTMEEGNKARFGGCPWEAIWYPLIDPERPEKNDFTSGPSLSDATRLGSRYAARSFHFAASPYVPHLHRQHECGDSSLRSMTLPTLFTSLPKPAVFVAAPALSPKKNVQKLPHHGHDQQLLSVPLSSLFSPHHLLLENPEVIKCLEDGHVSSGGRRAAESSWHHGMQVLLRPIAHSLAMIVPTNLLRSISKASRGRMKGTHPDIATLALPK